MLFRDLNKFSIDNIELNDHYLITFAYEQRFIYLLTKRFIIFWSLAIGNTNYVSNQTAVSVILTLNFISQSSAKFSI